jgi:hypothetical protein
MSWGANGALRCQVFQWEDVGNSDDRNNKSDSEILRMNLMMMSKKSGLSMGWEKGKKEALFSTV